MSASPGRRRADLSPRPYRLLRDDIAPKLSGRPGAAVAFLLLADPPEAPAPDLFLAVTANVGGGGLWSKEAVPLAAVAAAIDTWLSAQPGSGEGDAPRSFPTRALAAAYAGRSNNNAPFLAACLRHLGLLAAAPDTPHHHVLTADLYAFRQHGLAQAGEPTTYPPALEPHRHADPDGPPRRAGDLRPDGRRRPPGRVRARRPRPTACPAGRVPRRLRLGRAGHLPRRRARRHPRQPGRPDRPIAHGWCDDAPHGTPDFAPAWDVLERHDTEAGAVFELVFARAAGQPPPDRPAITRPVSSSS